MDMMLFAPELSLVITGLAVLHIGLFLPTDSKKILGYLASLGIVVALFFTVSSLGTQATAFNDTVSIDALSQFFKIGPPCRDPVLSRPPACSQRGKRRGCCGEKDSLQFRRHLPPEKRVG